VGETSTTSGHVNEPESDEVMGPPSEESVDARLFEELMGLARAVALRVIGGGGLLQPATGRALPRVDGKSRPGIPGAVLVAVR
jgi:hypothetical protein